MFYFTWQFWEIVEGKPFSIHIFNLENPSHVILIFFEERDLPLIPDSKLGNAEVNKDFLEE